MSIAFAPLWIVFSNENERKEYGIGLFSFSIRDYGNAALIALMLKDKEIRVNVLFAAHFCFTCAWV